MTTAFLNDIVIIPEENILAEFNNRLNIIVIHKENLENKNQKLTELKALLLSRLASV